jgi:hypothetical protein
VLAGRKFLDPIAETAPDGSTGAARLGILRAAAAAYAATEEVRSPMFVAATAPASAVVFLFALSFLCFMSGAALRRWPDKVQAYIERVDGSMWFVTADTHRALIQATALALTALSLLALIAARIVS